MKLFDSDLFEGQQIFKFQENDILIFTFRESTVNLRRQESEITVQKLTAPGRKFRNFAIQQPR